MLRKENNPYLLFRLPKSKITDLVFQYDHDQQCLERAIEFGNGALKEIFVEQAEAELCHFQQVIAVLLTFAFRDICPTTKKTIIFVLKLFCI